MSDNYVLYNTEGTVATITLNRPEYLNAIVRPMWTELDHFVAEANRDPEIKVIVLRGAGRAFCAGFDFGADGDMAAVRSEGRDWDPGRDAIGVTNRWDAPVPNFMGLWSSPKPTIAQVHGWCVGGGSDMALSADLVIAAEDAQIGTPYSRMWGCYLTAMWVYRLGLAKAKEYALTGKPLSGAEAAGVELINQAVPADQLDETVAELAEQLSSIPSTQLAAMKMVVNQAYEAMGMRNSQIIGALLDGAMRNTPEALAFIDKAMTEGVPAAVALRDGPFGDYSQRKK
ncbi:MAG: crotonase/enoyl-CoA hydratase family protein [Acidimicrobiia bacterium]|nr:crotonase/enoyl-CoA hydratase family protein [Acidimicrobiia bacterium]MYE74346.1 crotonase/enoyl-CoA hydratase family protein [Acidimicrobiia bacterium]MYJ62120.1 crotonase/enoyl-CoA hydratase family protein [Acidimicrobiia bacterium]